MADKKKCCVCGAEASCTSDGDLYCDTHCPHEANR